MVHSRGTYPQLNREENSSILKTNCKQRHSSQKKLVSPGNKLPIFYRRTQRMRPARKFVCAIAMDSCEPTFSLYHCTIISWSKCEAIGKSDSELDSKAPLACLCVHNCQATSSDRTGFPLHELACETQLYLLRKLMQGEPDSPKAPLGNNFRPVQPINHRFVRTNIDFRRKVHLQRIPHFLFILKHGPP